jgi:hypothetical protein
MLSSFAIYKKETPVILFVMVPPTSKYSGARSNKGSLDRENIYAPIINRIYSISGIREIA